MMKKINLLLLAMTFILFTNCKKDDSNSDNQQKPVPETVTTTNNMTMPSLFNLGGLLRNALAHNRQIQSTSTTTANYEYDGRHVTKITSNVDNGNGTDVYVSTYYYKDMKKGLLDSIVVKKNNNFDSVKRYTISNDKIQQISTYDSNYELTEQTSFSDYNGGKPSSMSLMTMSNQTPVNFSGTITYNGNDISAISLSASANGASMEFNFTMSYDNKKAMGLNIETLEMPIGAEHNVTTLTQTLTFNGNPYMSASTTNTYSYNNDGYPITYTFNSVASGSTIATGNVEIVYEDK